MGSFNLRGFASRISICYGDRIAAIICASGHDRPVRNKYYTCSTGTPVYLPIYGTYDDYGGIIPDDNPVNRWITEHIGKIEDLISAVREMHEFTRTIEKAKNSDNPYHPEESVRYIYDRLTDPGDTDGMPAFGFSSQDSLFVIFEHERFIKDAVKTVGDVCSFNGEKLFDKVKARITKTMEDFEKYNETLTNSAVHSDEEKKELRKELVSLFSGFGNNPFDYNFFGNDSYRALDILRWNLKFAISDDVLPCLEEMFKFTWYLIKNNLTYEPVMQYSQDMFYEEDIEYHELCIAILKDLQKNYEEEYGETEYDETDDDELREDE